MHRICTLSMIAPSEELEALYQRVNAKAMKNAEFRKEIMANPRETLEKKAGRPLPDDFNLKLIEGDNGYAATYIVPDFVQGELDVRELDSESLETVSGGFSFFLISSICAVAVAFGPCPGDACGANACGGNAGGVGGCGGAACGGDACGANFGCAAYTTGADACGANAGCAGYSSGSSACGANVGCAANAGGPSACASNQGCKAFTGV